MFEQPKIISAEISLGCNMTYDTNNFYHNTTVYTILLDKDHKADTLAYLSVLNSKVIWFFMTQTGTQLRGGFFRFMTRYMDAFPLPKLNKQNAQKLSTIAEQQLSTHKQLSTAKSDADKKLLEKRIEILDSQINAIVYDLYGLTEEEIKIVESC